MRVALLLMIVAACGGGGDRKKPARNGSGAVDYVDQLPPVHHDNGSAVAISDEIEPNDGEDVATVLPVGGSVRGKIGSDTDVDYYRIDVTTAGALALDLSEIEGFDLSVELEDASGTVLAKSDRGGIRVREGIPNYGLSAGRYIAVVRAKKPEPPKPPKPPKLKKGQKAPPPPPAPPPAGPSPVYTITASVAPIATGAEREPDDDRGTANDLILGDTATGFAGWTGDVDVYKLSLETLSGKNAIDIELAPVEGIALTLEIADGIGQPIITRKGARHGGVVVRGFVPAVPDGAAPFHYLTVRADRSNPETAYQLKVTEHTVAPDAEVEPNDSLDKPMAIPADRTQVKATWSAGDVDCFAIAPTDAARTLDLVVSVPDSVDLTAELLVDGKSVATSNHPGKGVAERVSGAVPAGGKAIVRIKAADSSATGEGAYSVTIAETAGAPAPP